MKYANTFSFVALLGADREALAILTDKGEVMKKRWIITILFAVLFAVLFAGCVWPDTVTKAYSFHPKLTIKVGGGKFIQGNTEFSESVSYHGKKDTIATIGWSRHYHTKYRTDGYNPRDYEGGLQYVDATPGTTFYLREIGASFEIISCDEKTIVIRVQ